MVAKGRSLIPIALFVVVMVFASPVRAQRYEPFGPVWDEFDHDLTPFAPADISSFDGGPDPNIGFFADYRRMYVNVNRPDQAPNNAQGDWTWGNRITAGYMTPDNYGWMVEVEHVDGPSIKQVQFFPTENPNTATTSREEFVNVAKLNSVEINREWRFKPLHEGSVVEAFFGFKYTKFEQWDGANVFVPPQGPLNNQPIGTLNGFYVQNNMYGPQAGLRWYKQKERWIVAAEGRYYYAFNDQIFEPFNPAVTGFSENQWVSAGDLRIEATYEIYKAMALSVGWDMLYMGTGVARNVPPFNDQAVLVTGVTFGFTMNR